MDPRILEALPEDLLHDLLRACWVVETARAEVYERWASQDKAYEKSARIATERAAIVDQALGPHRKKSDADVVGPHAAWIANLTGAPGDDPLGPLFMTRLSDWVDGHLAPLLEDGGRLKELSDDEKAGLALPDTLPEAPPFEPLEIPDVEAPADTAFRFGILGDLHIGSPRAETLGRAAIADLNASGAELVIQLGDITEQGQPDQFAAAAKIMGELDMPFATMMGNHDVLGLGPQDLTGADSYQTHFGRGADGVVLEHKGWRFAVLDSATPEPSPFTSFDLITGAFLDVPGCVIVQRSLSVPQHEILAELAEPGSSPAFVFLHHPPQPYAGFPPILFGLRDSDSGRLHAVADSGNVWGVFAGHSHRNAITRWFGHVPSVEVGIPRDYPFGYALVDVGPSGYSYRFHQLSDEGLLREAYPSAPAMQRRYGRGLPEERAFTWRAPRS